MTTERWIPWCMTFLVGLVAAGCLGREPRGTAQNTYVSTEDGEVAENVGSPQLARELVIESILTERRDDRLFIQFNLRNTKASNLSFEWNIEWYDAKGFKIDAPSNWTPAALGGKGYETITRTAPVPEAAGFRLDVRKPNSVR